MHKSKVLLGLKKKGQAKQNSEIEINKKLRRKYRPKEIIKDKIGKN